VHEFFFCIDERRLSMRARWRGRAKSLSFPGQWVSRRHGLNFVKAVTPVAKFRTTGQFVAGPLTSD
jgi:hypothetical protein